MSLKKTLSTIAFLTLAVSVAGCATPDVLVQEPVAPSPRLTRNALLELPPPASKLDVAVYKFEDVTGQFKPAEGFQNLSRAVSQGGASILVKALQDAGNRSWFTVIERSNLNHLLQERKIVSEMQQRYGGAAAADRPALPPMRVAGILMEGGIVGYDSNTLTGGAGARLLGIGASAEYRQDTISVDLRAVSVKTGEVMASTVVHKTLISTGVSGGSFSYIDVDKILELEAGITTNEPALIALTKAIEKAVHSLILEGADLGLWAFENKDGSIALINAHRVETGRDPLPVPTLQATELAQSVPANVPPAKAAPAPQTATPKPVAPQPATAKAVAPKPAPAPATAKAVAPKPAPVPVAAAPAAPQAPRSPAVTTRVSSGKGGRILRDPASVTPVDMTSKPAAGADTPKPARPAKAEAPAAATDKDFSSVALVTDLIANARTNVQEAPDTPPAVSKVSP